MKPRAPEDAVRYDIADILEGWPFDPERTVRRIDGPDGKAKLQVRLPLGILQYEEDGRPDGGRPYGCSSLLEYCEGQLAAYRDAMGTDKGFQISHDEFLELHEEGLLYYYRYVLLFQTGDYARAVRDTQRNIRLFDFCREHAGLKGDSMELEQHRPYIIRMNRAARAMVAVGKGRFADALAEVDEGIS